MSEKIIFNGRVYRSVSEMPPDERQLYERLEKLVTDADRDGVPDILQEGSIAGVKQVFGFMKDISQMSKSGKTLHQHQLAIIKVTDTSITVNGKTFRSVGEMPAEVRRVYQSAVNEADPGSVEIFDEPWRERERDSYFKPHDDELIEPKYMQSPTQSVMEPVISNLGLVIALVLVIVFIAIGVLIWLSNPGIF
ncbi:MAG: hypothetical protein ISS57_02130 [Anaerolineales bacterium]|nr:hypothetical protein [Anaerolineales bacterium]